MSDDLHESSCSVYNAPAYEPGPCDCKYREENIIRISATLAKGGMPIERVKVTDGDEENLKSRPMTGLLSQLAPEQLEKALSYDGPEYLGGDPDSTDNAV